jgi:uncharacterized protein
MAQNNDDVDLIATEYLNNNVINEDVALQGARDIIAEWINENIYVRKQLRRHQRTATVSTKVVKKARRRKSTKVSSIFRLVRTIK